MINIGIVGAGYWGQNLIRKFSNLSGACVKKVCDRNVAPLKRVEEKWPEIRLTSSYHNVIKDKTIDAIAVATPVSTHHEISIDALRAKKHVLIEKPLARRYKDANELVRTVRKSKLILAAGHIMMYHPAVIKTNEMIGNGKVGKLCFAESCRSNPRPMNCDVDVIWDLAVHDV